MPHPENQLNLNMIEINWSINNCICHVQISDINEIIFFVLFWRLGCASGFFSFFFFFFVKWNFCEMETFLIRLPFLSELAEFGMNFLNFPPKYDYIWHTKLLWTCRDKLYFWNICSSFIYSLSHHNSPCPKNLQINKTFWFIREIRLQSWQIPTTTKKVS